MGKSGGGRSEAGRSLIVESSTPVLTESRYSERPGDDRSGRVTYFGFILATFSSATTAKTTAHRAHSSRACSIALIVVLGYVYHTSVYTTTLDQRAMRLTITSTITTQRRTHDCTMRLAMRLTVRPRTAEQPTSTKSTTPDVTYDELMSARISC